MANDAKLGMVVGVGLVILISVVFFRKPQVIAAPETAAMHGSSQLVSSPAPDTSPVSIPADQQSGGQ